MKNFSKSILGLVIFSLVLFSCKTDPHEHSYSDKWSSNETEHWHEATCEHSSEVSDKAAHTFGEWKVTKDSTDETEGSQERSCTVCSYKETKVIEKKDHNHSIATDWSFDSEKHWHAASCGKEEHNKDISDHKWNNTEYEYDAKFGKNIRVCNVCFYVDIKDHIHTEDSGKVTTEPDCVTKGVRTYMCTVCNAVARTEEVDAKGHTEDSGKVTTEPGCFTKGVKTYKCSVCNAEVRTEDVPATGHIEEFVIIKEATISSAGVMECKCKQCDYIFRKELYCGPSEIYEEEVVHEEQYVDPITETFYYIYFGIFPKSTKPSSVTVAEEEIITMGGNTYYHGSDDQWYAKVDSNYYKVEPIKWKILLSDYDATGKVLLLSDYVLTGDVRFYFDDEDYDHIRNTYINPNNYKYSTIRAYLNGKYEKDDIQPSVYKNKGFLQTAFGADAQTMIIETEVNNGAETTGFGGLDGVYHYTYTSAYACDNTNDKIFLLSQSEVENIEIFARIRKVTDYAKANKVKYSNGCGLWWTRSPDFESNYQAIYIAENGGLGNVNNVYDYWNGVVPAMWINLK